MVTRYGKRRKMLSKSRYYFMRWKNGVILIYVKSSYQKYLRMTQNNIFFHPPLNVCFVVLRDKIGGRSHTVGINSGFEIMYYCMETHELKLNKQNLNKYRTQNCEFQFLCVAVELRDNKVHEKTNKEITIDVPFKTYITGRFSSYLQ